MYAQTFLATLLLAAVGTNAAAMQKQARQFDDLLAGIRGWKDISACDDSTTADFDYNIPMVNGTVSDTCVPLPADLATVQVSALRQDMQGKSKNVSCFHVLGLKTWREVRKEVVSVLGCPHRLFPRLLFSVLRSQNRGTAPTESDSSGKYAENWGTLPSGSLHMGVVFPAFFSAVERGGIPERGEE